MSEKNCTHQNIADLLHVRRQTIGKYTNGLIEPNIDTLDILADYFGVSVDYLLGREDDFGNITIQNDSPQMTASERELLENFRSLSPYLQGIAAETIRNWAGKPAQKSETTTKRA